MAIDDIKVEFDFYKKTLKAVNSSSTKNALGEVLRKEVLDFIEEGISPIKGRGKFKGYKVDRGGGSDNPRAYPNSVKKKYPRKRKRPINLELSGKFLKALTYKKTKEGIKFGFFGMNDDIRDKYETHNLGLDKYVPKRKFLPTVDGEEYSLDITKALEKTLDEILRKKLRLK